MVILISLCLSFMPYTPNIPSYVYIYIHVCIHTCTYMHVVLRTCTYMYVLVHKITLPAYCHHSILHMHTHVHTHTHFTHTTHAPYSIKRTHAHTHITHTTHAPYSIKLFEKRFGLFKLCVQSSFFIQIQTQKNACSH